MVSTVPTSRRLSRPAWKRTPQERMRIAVRKEVRHRRRLLVMMSRKNPPMFDLQPLPEPRQKKLGIGAQLHVRRRNWLLRIFDRVLRRAA